MSACKDTNTSWEVSYATGTAIILCGMPGSGKGELARSIKGCLDKACVPTRLLSAVDTFTNAAGKVTFDRARLGEAKERCFRDFVFLSTMDRPHRPNLIVVDNPNLTIEDIEPYYAQARKAGFMVEVMKLVCSLERAWACNQYGIDLLTLNEMYKQSQSLCLPKEWNVSELLLPARYRSAEELIQRA